MFQHADKLAASSTQPIGFVSCTQIAFGSGFKCNSAVWVANRNIKDKTDTWEVSSRARFKHRRTYLMLCCRLYQSSPLFLPAVARHFLSFISPVRRPSQ